MWNDDLFSEAAVMGSRARTWFTPRCHSVFNAANQALGFVPFPVAAREIPILSDELQLKMQLLVRESLMALMRLNDGIVIDARDEFQQARKRNFEWTQEGRHQQR